MLALKTTVYRTNQESPLGPALARRSRPGKQAVCLVELKARFDERHNIEWSRRLERAGVHVVYGFPNLKIHAKMTLVVRRDDGRRAPLRPHRHAATTTRSPPGSTRTSASSPPTPRSRPTSPTSSTTSRGSATRPRSASSWSRPWGLRSPDPRRDRAGRRGRRGRAASRIRLKLNALTDETIIDALYLASQQGVRIDIVARGICCLRPGRRGAEREHHASGACSAGSSSTAASTSSRRTARPRR